MRVRQIAKWLAICASILSGWLLALIYWIGYINVHPSPPDLNASDRWTLVKQYRGPLDREHGDLIARVYVYGRPYLQNNDEDYEVAQNRIDLHDLSGKQIATFMWPGGRVVYAGGWCEILDVNNDGTKEFLLFDDRGSVRVVSYENGSLQHKAGFWLLNEIDSAGFQIGPLDLDGDGELEFISEDLLPDSIDAKEYVYIAKVNHWDPQSGFQDVSTRFPQYYEKNVLPEFRNRAANGNPHVRAAYLQAIDYIEKKILKKAATPAASDGYSTSRQQIFPSK